MSSQSRKNKRLLSKCQSKLHALIYNMILFSRTHKLEVEQKLKYKELNNKWLDICLKNGLSDESKELFKLNVDELWKRAKKVKTSDTSEN